MAARAEKLTAEDLPELRRVLRRVHPSRTRGDGLNILFVCLENTDRSYMAEHLAKEQLRRSKQSGIEVFSRGLFAENGAPSGKEAAAALRERGISVPIHASESLTAQDVARADLILPMDYDLVRGVVDKYPESAGKTVVLSEYAGRQGGIEDAGGARGHQQLAEKLDDALVPIFRRVEAVKTLEKKEAELAQIKRDRLSSARSTVIPLGALDDDFVALVGGKSAKLGEIISAVRAAGGYVPEGVALTTEAYLRFLRESGLEAKVLAAASELDAILAKSGLDTSKGSKAVEEYSARIQELLRSAKLDPANGLGREILAGLNAHGLKDASFAVRSSAVQEDGDEAAFAGAAETHLYVRPEDVLNKVVETWASFWLPRGIQYRWQQGIRSTDLKPAVTIQRMAEAESAGVMFTRDPASGKRNIVINAAFGLGEGVVSGLVQADQYTTDRSGEEISLPVLGDKKVQIVPQEGGRGTEERRVPLRQRKQWALTTQQVKALARIGAALEEHFGFPLDIEFAVEKDRIAIVQARPITVKR